MTRQEALEQVANLTPADMLAIMRGHEGYTGFGSYDDISKACVRWLDYIAKTSAEKLSDMTLWVEIVDHVHARKVTPPVDFIPIVGRGWLIEYNECAERLQVVFEKFPRKEARELVKSSGFYWSPSLGAWVKKYSCKACRAIDMLVPQLSAIRIY